MKIREFEDLKLLKCSRFRTNAKIQKFKYTLVHDLIFQSCSHPNIKQKDIRIQEIQSFTPRNVRQNPITDIAMTSNYRAREKLILP